MTEMTLRLRLREVHWAAGASVRAHGVRCRPGAERGLEASTGHPAVCGSGTELEMVAPAAWGVLGRQRHGGDTSSLTDP